MPARCLIVDDEDLARQQITRLLAAQPDFQVSGEARNGVEALELIPELKGEHSQAHLAFNSRGKIGL